VYKKENSRLKDTLLKKLHTVNQYIDKTEKYTAITAPESSLGIILGKQSTCYIELKSHYVRKRKLMYLLDYINDTRSFTCHDCGKRIDVERLILIPNAHFCQACLSSEKTSA